MVFTYVNGRCGNQLFYYAISRAIDEKYTGGCSELVFDERQVNILHTKDGDGFEDSLNYFSTKKYLTVDESLLKVILKTGDLSQKLLYGVYSIAFHVMKDKRSGFFMHFNSILWKHGLFIMHPFHTEALKNFRLPDQMKKKNYYVAGPFEKSSLFNDIRQQLLEELSSKKEVLANRELYNTICNTNSVCISIRRGDYESNAKARKTFSICDKTYFERSIAEIRNRVENPVFIMFSDDIEWVKKNIDIEGVVLYETGIDPVWEKLRLMSGCKHFIISNSTFSWWAQWLSRNEEKIVVSPDIWYRPNVKWPLLEKSFIQIPIN
ncbi:alpha-1,2-fucosyltransferase [Butyrivibrio sp. MC2013]|uniref:alpha-1,2-fucosyltransferase n=1 Tax=Butyrivibrio sp. MC2013 TaxID=1280686 RepID=UPI000422C28D|nr:alpha-1,2-fucosyltransferase [Butyrivibrio sp. MC2013]